MIITIYGTKKKTRKQREKEKLAWKEQQAQYSRVGISKSGKSWTPEVTRSVNSTLDLHRDRSTSHIPSKDSGIGVAVKKEANTYTGDKLIGIGNLHKSNLVPVFKSDEAKDLASMRR